MCVGFPAGGTAHHLEDRGTGDAVFLEVGDRGSGEEVVFPHGDVRARMQPDGHWNFTRLDGSPL
jgi:uncharacterized cupin superfamily protein